MRIIINQNNGNVAVRSRKGLAACLSVSTESGGKIVLAQGSV